MCRSQPSWGQTKRHRIRSAACRASIRTTARYTKERHRPRQPLETSARATKSKAENVEATKLSMTQAEGSKHPPECDGANTQRQRHIDHSTTSPFRSQTLRLLRQDALPRSRRMLTTRPDCETQPKESCQYTAQRVVRTGKWTKATALVGTQELRWRSGMRSARPGSNGV